MVLVPSHKIVDANANKPGIIDLFKSHSLGLIGLEDAKDDQDQVCNQTQRLDAVNQSQMKVENRIWDYEQIMLIESVH